MNIENKIKMIIPEAKSSLKKIKTELSKLLQPEPPTVIVPQLVSIQNNRNVGGKTGSKHLQGLAIDFKFSTPALTREFGKGVFEAKWAKQTQGWAGYYPDKNIIHIQLNSKKPDPK